MKEEYKKNTGYSGNDNPTHPERIPEDVLTGNKGAVKPGATNGYPMTGFENGHFEKGTGTKPTRKM